MTQHPKHPDVEILKSERVYDGFFKMDRFEARHRSFAGDWTRVLNREVFERGHCGAVLPYDPDRDEVVLLQQFRLPAMLAGFDPWLIEIVAGIYEGDESGEDLVRRETGEETGLTAGRLEEIGTYLMSPGGMTESITLFVGEVESAKAGGVHGVAEEGEDIRVFSLPVKDAFEWRRSGKINNAIGAIALMWLELNHESLRAKWRAG
jgi:ADP-ribose pyrophosphatase